MEYNLAELMKLSEDARFKSPSRSAIVQCYEHLPLDHQAPSIRLVRVLPLLSPDGLIQCAIQHASIESTYVCLSYVWGSTAEGTFITLNGNHFWVRKNLWEFLRCARLKRRDECLWIDAICIDQSNNSERAHQVQQMGRIFSNAIKVISWLGQDEELESCFRRILAGESYSFNDLDYFNCCEYWERAWVGFTTIYDSHQTLTCSPLLDHTGICTRATKRFHDGTP